MAIEVRPATVRELQAQPNFQALLDEYAAESAIFGLPHPSAKMEVYHTLEQTGMFTILSAWQDDLLLGFITILMSDLPHYSHVIAISESFFVGSAYRKTGAGTYLRLSAEDFVDDSVALGLIMSAPTGGILADILPNVGYDETGKVFFRRRRDRQHKPTGSTPGGDPAHDASRD